MLVLACFQASCWKSTRQASKDPWIFQKFAKIYFNLHEFYCINIFGRTKNENGEGDKVVDFFFKKRSLRKFIEKLFTQKNWRGRNQMQQFKSVNYKKWPKIVLTFCEKCNIELKRGGKWKKDFNNTLGPRQSITLCSRTKKNMT